LEKGPDSGRCPGMPKNEKNSRTGGRLPASSTFGSGGTQAVSDWGMPRSGKNRKRAAQGRGAQSIRNKGPFSAAVITRRTSIFKRRIPAGDSHSLIRRDSPGDSHPFKNKAGFLGRGRRMIITLICKPMFVSLTPGKGGPGSATNKKANFPQISSSGPRRTPVDNPGSRQGEGPTRQPRWALGTFPRGGSEKIEIPRE